MVYNLYMKICTTCQEEKPLSEFNKNKHRPDGLQNVCRECSRERSRKYYAENRDKHRAAVKENKIKYRDILYKSLWDYLLVNPCTDCNEQDPRVLEFDHLSDKKRNISDMMRAICSWESVLEEIEKCEVVCANCHRKRTYERSDSWRHRLHIGDVA